MKTLQKSTHVRGVDQEERWYLYDASEHVLGRMAVKIATQLTGKDRPEYTPSELANTHVVVIHAERAVVTGKKNEQKEYAWYTGYPGGRRTRSLAEMREKRAADVIRLAVRRMLPKTRLGRSMLRHLKVYEGAEHPHAAQKPTKVESL